MFALWRGGVAVRSTGWEVGLEFPRATGTALECGQQHSIFDPPWVRVKHLASHLLSQAARRIDADWRQRYVHGVDWLETFVDRGRFRGSCYRAANWECVGQTQGRSRQDRDHQLQVPVKDVYLYDLKRRRSQ
jgi:hypothetical protein